MNSKNLVLILSLIMVSLFLLSSVSASENVDNAINAGSDNDIMNEMAIGVDSEYKSIATEDNVQLGLDDDSIMAQDSEVIKYGDNGNDESLKSQDDADSIQIGNSVQDVLGVSNFDVKFPKTAYFYKSDQDEYPDSFNIVISISKNASGILAIYNNNELCKKIKLDSNVPLKSKGDDIPYEYEYIVTSEGDLYKIKFPIISNVGKNNVVVKFNDGKKTVEKSAVVNGKFYVDCNKYMVYGTKTIYIMSTCIYHDFDAKLSAQIDGKKYTVKKNGELYYIKLSSILPIGKHTMKVTYLGPKYPSHSVQGQFDVLGVIDNIAYGNSYGFKSYDGDKISLVLPKNAKGNLVVQFYNSENKVVKTFSKKLVNGKASISVVNSKSYGEYSKVVGKYTGKDYKVKTAVGESVSIYPPFNMPNKIVKGEKKYISLSLPSGKEGILKIVVRPKDDKGTYYNSEWLKISKNLVNGKANISLSKFKVGDVHKVSFVETVNGKKVYEYSYNVRVDILNPLKIVSSKLHYGKANVKIKAYKAVGKPLVNKVITVKVNNKAVKKVKTNKNGVAVFKMPKKYKPNTYKITAQYNKDSISKNIKIIK